MNFTVLGESRFPSPIRRTVDDRARVPVGILRAVDILFTIGDDGTQRGGDDLVQEAWKCGDALAESAGQDLLANTKAERDASGDVRLQDIGQFLRDRIESHFKARGVPAVMRHFDPSYLVRSSPANAEDSILCDLFARNAAHAAMAGKTGLVIGFLHERFIHVLIELLASQQKRLDPGGPFGSAVLATTGQPEHFA